MHSITLNTSHHGPLGRDGLTLLTSINPALKSHLAAVWRRYWV